MKIRIKGGTARHDEPSLCLSCRSARIVQGQSMRDEIIQCSELDTRISFKVSACTQYVHRGHPSLWHMEDIAWVLRTDPKNRQIGFVRSRELRSSLRHVLSDDE